MANAGASLREELAVYALKVVIAVGIAGGIVTVMALLWLALDVMLLGFAGVLLAVLLRALANWLARHTPLAQGWAVLVAVVLLVLLVGVSLWFSASRVVREAETMARFLPHVAENMRQRLLLYEWGEWLVQQIDAIDWSSRRIDVLGKTTGALSSVFGTLVNLLIVAFLGLYLAVQPELYLKGFIRLFPVPRRERIREVLLEIGRSLQWWLVGILLSMTLIGVVTGTGLWLLGVHFPLALALLAALLAFVPYIGPVLSAIPALLVSAGQGTEYVLYVALLYLGIQTVESYLLSPVIQQYTVSLPPALLLFGQITLGIMLGGMGVVLAAPLTVVAVVAVRMLYIEDVLEAQTQAAASRISLEESGPGP